MEEHYMTKDQLVADAREAVERKLPDPTVEPTITIDRTAPLLGISRASAYAAARSGEIPTIRIGRRLLVPTAALRKLLGLDD